MHRPIPGVSVAWSGASYQERIASGQAPLLYAVSLMVIFLCLAALYESWSIPLAVLLVVPLGLVGAILFVTLRGLQNDVFLQIGLLTTMGLTSKNAILMNEFAERAEKQGKRVIDAAVEAARIRLRPILMTSFAFIFGVSRSRSRADPAPTAESRSAPRSSEACSPRPYWPFSTSPSSTSSCAAAFATGSSSSASTSAAAVRPKREADGRASRFACHGLREHGADLRPARSGDPRVVARRRPLSRPIRSRASGAHLPAGFPGPAPPDPGRRGAGQ